MTSSHGMSGLIAAGSPPSSAIASRIAARSTTAGTPVKSCSSTRAGRKESSRPGVVSASQSAMAAMSSAVTDCPSSCRTRFSSTTLIENGRRDRSLPVAEATARRSRIETGPLGASSEARAAKESRSGRLDMVDLIETAKGFFPWAFP